MPLTKVTRNHQITLPKGVREAMGVEVGDHVDVRWENGRIVVVPVRLEEAAPSPAPTGVAGLRRAMAPILRRCGVEAAWLFGSAARGEAGPGSDVDLLVEYPEGFGFDDLADLGKELERAVGRKVDLVRAGRLKTRVRDQVEREKVAIL